LIIKVGIQAGGAVPGANPAIPLHELSSRDSEIVTKCRAVIACAGQLEFPSWTRRDAQHWNDPLSDW